MRRPDIFQSDKDISELVIGPWSVSLFILMIEKKMTNEWWDILGFCFPIWYLEKCLSCIDGDFLFTYATLKRVFWSCYWDVLVDLLDQLITMQKAYSVILFADVLLLGLG